MHSHNTKNLLNILVLLECKSKYLKNATAVNLKLTQTHFERNWKITVKQPKIYLSMCLIATITNFGSMRCLTMLPDGGYEIGDITIGSAW